MKIQSALFLSALILANLACGLGSSTPAQGGDPAQSGGSSSSGKPTAAGCDNPYYPVKNGASWEYELTGSLPGSMTRTLADVTETDFSVQESLQGGAELLNDWSCDDGDLTMSSIEMEGYTTLSSKGISIPGDLKEGSTWTQELVYETKAGDMEMTTTITNTCTAKGSESVTVPAGTFDAMLVECKMLSTSIVKGTDTPTTAEVANQTWYATGVGMVKSKNSVSGYESEYLLKAYKIP